MMARYVVDLQLNKPNDFVAFIMNDYLQKNQFSMSNWKGEPAYRAGDAMMEGYKFLKWYYSNGVLHLEAWLKGTFGGEWGLEGFVGFLMKKPYKESLSQLMVVLQQPLPQTMPMGQPGMPSMNQQMVGGNGQFVPPVAPQPVVVTTVDNSGAAIAALVLGIVALVLGFISPLFSIIAACIAFSMARMGSGSSKAGCATAGKVMSIVGLCIAIVMWVLNIVYLSMKY